MKITQAPLLLGFLLNKVSLATSTFPWPIGDKSDSIDDSIDEDDIKMQIKACVDHPDTSALITKINDLEKKRTDRNAPDNGGGAYYVPFYTQLERDLFELPYPINPDNPIPWSENVVKAEYKNVLSTADGDEFGDYGHKKFPALPFWILSFFNQDPETFKSDDIRNTVFLMNLEDRGPRNKRKKAYMSALTCDKLRHYETKIHNALDDFIKMITEEGKPVMSAFNNVILELYLKLHFGEVDGGHPQFVVDHVANVFLGLSQLGLGSKGELVDLQKELVCTSDFVEAYYEQRRRAIVKEKDKTTFVFWWDAAGIPFQALNFEAAHNALAFGQFTNFLFLALRAKVAGYLALDFAADPPTIAAVGGPIDFFTKYANAHTSTDRINVVREAFRTLLPNNGQPSNTETAPGANDGKAPSDANFDLKETLHNTLLIQFFNDGYTPATGTTHAQSYAGTYDTTRYEDFGNIPDIPNGCPFSNAFEHVNSWNVNGFFRSSRIDGETVIPKGHEKFFPVFDVPKYCPFGLGYRRCPAELFNYFMAGKILEKLEPLTIVPNILLPPGLPEAEVAQISSTVLFLPPQFYPTSDSNSPFYDQLSGPIFDPIDRVPAAVNQVPDVFYVVP